MNEVAVLAALLIVFREVFEAGLIVGIIMAVTAGVPRPRLLDDGRRRRRRARRLPGRGVHQRLVGTVQRQRPGIVQRRHSRLRRADARLAQCVDVAPRPRTCRRDARRRRGGRCRLEVAVRARRRGGDRGAARGFGSRAVSLWRRGVAGRRQLGDGRRRLDRTHSRLAGLPPDLSRPGHHPDALSVRRHHAR